MPSKNVQTLEKCAAFECQLAADQATETGNRELIECAKCEKKFHFVCKNLERTPDLEEAIAQKSYFCSQQCVNQHCASIAGLEQKFQAILAKLSAFEVDSEMAKVQRDSELMTVIAEKFAAMEKSLSEKLVVASCGTTAKLVSLDEKLDHQDNGLQVIIEKINILNHRTKKQRTHAIIIGRRINSMEYDLERVVEEMTPKASPPKEHAKATGNSPNLVNGTNESSAGAGAQPHQQNRNYNQQPPGRSFDNRGQQQGRNYDNQGGGYQSRGGGGGGGGYRGSGSRPPYGGQQQSYGGQQQRRY